MLVAKKQCWIKIWMSSNQILLKQTNLTSASHLLQNEPMMLFVEFFCCKSEVENVCHTSLIKAGVLKRIWQMLGNRSSTLISCICSSANGSWRPRSPTHHNEVFWEDYSAYAHTIMFPTISSVHHYVALMWRQNTALWAVFLGLYAHFTIHNAVINSNTPTIEWQWHDVSHWKKIIRRDRMSEILPERINNSIGTSMCVGLVQQKEETINTYTLFLKSIDQ